MLVTSALAGVAAAQTTNASAAAYMLPTNSASFFYADRMSGATYYQFNPDGTYVMIAKEHMGVLPLDKGRWSQTSDGTMTMVSTNEKRTFRDTEVVRPMQYKGKTFLVWPDRKYAADLASVCLFIDSPTNAYPIRNEFMITEAEFLKGTSKPYSFKFYPEMNKVTGAE